MTSDTPAADQAAVFARFLVDNIFAAVRAFTCRLPYAASWRNT